MLRLGPTIGRIGGGVEPLEITVESPAAHLTIDLPDGEWCVVVETRRDSNNVSQNSVLINGTEAATFSAYNESWGYAVARHVTEVAEVATEGKGYSLISAVAFPDPTT